MSCESHLEENVSLADGNKWRPIDTRFPALIVAYVNLSQTEISYWWRKICPESGQELWLVHAVVPLGETSLAAIGEEKRLFCQATNLSP